MKCVLLNDCATPALCCAFCDNKRCDRRCKDDHEQCRFFINEKYEAAATEPQKRRYQWIKKKG